MDTTVVVAVAAPSWTVVVTVSPAAQPTLEVVDTRCSLLGMELAVALALTPELTTVPVLVELAIDDTELVVGVSLWYKAIAFVPPQS